MNFYIDFDHTLYNTNEFITDMLTSIAKYIADNGNFEEYPNEFKKIFPDLDVLPIDTNIDSIFNALKDNFKRPEETYLKIDYNIYILVDVFSSLFSCDKSEMLLITNSIISHGEKYLYDDCIPFIKTLKENGNNVYILSHEKLDLDYQNKKILGSKIAETGLLDGLIVTKISKATLNEENYNNPLLTIVTNLSNTSKLQKEVDYKSGIFIDDRIKDLENLYEAVYANESEKTRIYRIVRPNQTYSQKNFTSDKYKHGIQTITSLYEILQ